MQRKMKQINMFAVALTATLGLALGGVGSVTAQPNSVRDNGVIESVPGRTPVASTMAFPYVYQNLFFPAYGMTWDYYVYFTPAQTRTIRDTGLVPAFAGSGLPYSGIGQTLQRNGTLDKVVAAHGCLHIGINRTDKYSPVQKKRIAWFAWTIYVPKEVPVYCR